MVSVHMVCNIGHAVKWCSQPVVRRFAEGNVRLAAAVVFSGNTYTRLKDICNYSNIRCFSYTAFLKYQKNYTIGVVNERWLSWRQNKFGALHAKGRCKVAGDARCDSPGHCAKYSTYSFQDQDTCEIIAIDIMQVTEVGNSNRMEKAGFVKVLNKVETHGVKVDQITTDRHPQVRKYMRENRKDIRYQFDVLHVCKNIIKVAIW